MLSKKPEKWKICTCKHVTQKHCPFIEIEIYKSGKLTKTVHLCNLAGGY